MAPATKAHTRSPKSKRSRLRSWSKMYLAENKKNKRKRERNEIEQRRERERERES